MHEEYVQDMYDHVKKQNTWRKKECINLIASENVSSPLVDDIRISDFMHRYAEGLPYQRYYQGTKYIDYIENKVVELAKKIFDVNFVEPRAISGTVANLAVFSALTNHGDNIATLSIPAGAHISHLGVGCAGICGLKQFDLPFDEKEMNIDVDKTITLLDTNNFSLIVLGTSLFLFPAPVKELKEAIGKETKIVYDAAHVLGLIAAKEFQDPIREGADVISSSTHKTLPGPQGGIILTNNAEYYKKISRAVFPGIVSNHHLARLPGLVIALAEMLDFGKEYATQMIVNAKKLAESLYERGFQVLCEHKNFTQSHQVAVDVQNYGGGTKVATKLEKANIICNKNLLPWDKPKKSLNPSGIRIGTTEMTHVGMKEKEMERIAEFITDTIIKEKDKEKIKKEIIEFKQDFLEVKYTYELSNISPNSI